MRGRPCLAALAQTPRLSQEGKFWIDQEDLLGRMHSLLVTGFTLTATVFAAPTVFAADSVADFYHGKTLHIVVGAAAGGGYDLVGRTIASRLGSHIPGNPTIVVENMPSAGGLTMANFLYNTAPKDGTTIGLPTNATALEPQLKVLTHAGGTANFDIAKFSWLGTAAQAPQVLFVWHTAGVQTAEDLKTTKVILGALSAGSDSYLLPTVMNKILGAKMQIVPGYEGQSDTFVAMERGEIQGHSDGFAGLIGQRPDWVRDKLVRILIQFGRTRLSQLPDVPTAIELATDELDKDMLRFYAYKYDIAYALIAPPHVPAERVEALRKAFDDTMSDPQYQDAAKHIALPLNSLNGDAVTKIIAAIQSTPQTVVDHAREMMVPKSAN
jgi:tripartite-type tricarboxylate transporter receptor subunit TctC